MLIDQNKFFCVVLFLFLIGSFGIILNRKNILIMLMAIEILLLSVNVNFIIFSVFLDDLIGLIFSLFILAIAAAESAIGLAILVVYFRIRYTISIQFINLIKG